MKEAIKQVEEIIKHYNDGLLNEEETINSIIGTLVPLINVTVSDDAVVLHRKPVEKN